LSELILEPGRAEKNYWRDIWHYRELFYILSWRDIKVRYKQTVIGAAWSVVRPLLTTVIFTLLFKSKLQSAGSAPYALMVFVGMLPWQFFSTSLSEASNSLISNTNLITKVYFPRMIVPASSVITSLVDLAISFIILIGMFVFYQFAPPLKIFALPAFIIMAFIASFGTGLYLTALNVKYRDFRFIVPFIIQFGMYVSPVIFSSSLFGGKWWRILFYINPMAGVIDGFRWSLLNEKLYWQGLLMSLLVCLLFLWLGIYYFRKTEKTFADNI
jgi:lipopolysaccharide transport system permease protein